MTPEQRATVIGLAFIAAVQKELMKPGAADLEFKVAIEDALEHLRSDIAAALTPSEAVKELLTAADELRTIVQFDGTTKTPRYDRAATAVREELGL